MGQARFHPKKVGSAQGHQTLANGEKMGSEINACLLILYIKFHKQQNDRTVDRVKILLYVQAPRTYCGLFQHIYYTVRMLQLCVNHVLLFNICKPK